MDPDVFPILRSTMGPCICALVVLTDNIVVGYLFICLGAAEIVIIHMPFEFKISFE